MVAWRQDRKEGPRNRRHAAPGNQGLVGALQYGQLSVQALLVWRVVVSDVPDPMLTVLEHGGLEDRHPDRTANPRMDVPCMHEVGIDGAFHGVRDGLGY